jgi:putative tricarboxylic transport membrane protein
MKTYDQYSTLFWIFVALLICIESARLPLGSLGDPGPGLLPLGAGAILGMLSCVCYAQARLTKSQGVTQAWFPQERWKGLGLVLSALIGYAICLEFLGFLLTTFFLMIILFRGVEPQKWTVTILGSALTSFLSYALFQLWLKTQLPTGIFGF